MVVQNEVENYSEVVDTERTKGSHFENRFVAEDPHDEDSPEPLSAHSDQLFQPRNDQLLQPRN